MTSTGFHAAEKSNPYFLDLWFAATIKLRLISGSLITPTMSAHERPCKGSAGCAKVVIAPDGSALLSGEIRPYHCLHRSVRSIGKMCEPLADRKLTGKGWRRSLALVGVLLTCWLFARTSDATSYTWIGTTSSDWTTTGNWSSLGFPNAYTDTATIGATGLNKPVILSISSTVLLGGAGVLIAPLECTAFEV